MTENDFEAKLFDAETEQHSVLLNSKDAESLGVRTGDHVKVSAGEKNLYPTVNISDSLVEEGRIGTFVKVSKSLDLKEGDRVSVNHVSSPKSAEYVHKVMKGSELNSGEIHTIVEDVVNGRLSIIDKAAFLTTQEIRGMSMEETAALTRSMIDTGEAIDIKNKPVMDVHSIGGVPGNKYSLLTVPIVAAVGLTIPKTSSRAITSPAGTADLVEVLADVSFSLEEISEIVDKVGGVLAWGGAVNLAPADDILINVERSLDIDPRCQLLASVMSKKLAMSSEKILIDIPTGAGAKIESEEDAENLSHDFMNLGHKLGVEVETATTYGGQLLGHCVGPRLETGEALKTLQGEGPTSLKEKGTGLAGILLEMGGEASSGKGKEIALEILKSGKAYEKFLEIIEAQGGGPDVNVDDLPLGDKTETIEAKSDGYVKRIFNSSITNIARAAGAPDDKGAGLRLLKKEGLEVKKGEPLIEIYAEYEKKLDDAVKIAKNNPPVKVEGMLLDRFSSMPRSE